jgi:hypothetical protein
MRDVERRFAFQPSIYSLDRVASSRYQVDSRENACAEWNLPILELAAWNLSTHLHRFPILRLTAQEIAGA